MDRGALLALAETYEGRALVIAELVADPKPGAGTIVQNAAFAADLFAIAQALRALAAQQESR